MNKKYACSILIVLTFEYEENTEVKIPMDVAAHSLQSSEGSLNKEKLAIYQLVTT
jgi:hypothetical protein